MIEKLFPWRRTIRDLIAALTLSENERMRLVRRVSWFEDELKRCDLRHAGLVQDLTQRTKEAEMRADSVHRMLLTEHRTREAAIKDPASKVVEMSARGPNGKYVKKDPK